jgi:hypothetical protein
VVSGVEGRVREAYELLCELTRRYAESRARSKARAKAAALAMALFREGLPMTAAAQLLNTLPKPGPGSYLVLPLLRPGAVVHEYIVTPVGFEEVKRLLREVQPLHRTQASLVRTLQYEADKFRESYGLRVRPLDAYALKLYVMNLSQYLSGKYSVRRLKLAVEHILSRAPVLAAPEG